MQVTKSSSTEQDCDIACRMLLDGSSFVYSLIMDMGAVCVSKILLGIYQTTVLHPGRFNLKFNKGLFRNYQFKKCSQAQQIHNLCHIKQTGAELLLEACNITM
jgi:hypothetical protein